MTEYGHSIFSEGKLLSEKPLDDEAAEGTGAITAGDGEKGSMTLPSDCC